MSYYSDDLIWVSDLDGYISISGLNNSHSTDYEKHADQKHKNCNLWGLGDISLLGGGSVRLKTSNYIGLGPSDWSWAIHEAEKSIGVDSSEDKLEEELLKALIRTGRKYAVNRYAKWEKIPSVSALTASLPLGFKALLLQYLSGQGLLSAVESRKRIWNTLSSASSAENIVAYQRVSKIQNLIHELAIDSSEKFGAQGLNKNATREILSLARLHYSVEELRVNDFSDIAKLLSMYALARETVEGNHVQGNYIPNWQKRHLRPLTDLYPYSIRKALLRIAYCANSDVILQRKIAINELALVKFELLSMGKSYR